MKKIIFLFLLNCFYNITNAQGNLMDSIIQKNYHTFEMEGKNRSFKGKGWEILLTEINNANSVLLGETHFTKEIPYFTNAIIDAVKFDNYFQEIDPFSTQIIASKIKSLSSEKLHEFVKEYNSNFSFLQIEEDFSLYKKIVQSGIKTFGVEQISLYASNLIISELNENSKNNRAREIYMQMLHQAQELSLQDKKKRYLFSEDCLDKINLLLTLDLSSHERQQIEALKLSREIYLNRNHHLRVQLMKNILLKEMSNWTNGKNLFKFGAFHTPKGESLIEIFDIGNLVYTIEDSNFRTSLHVMVIGKSKNETMDDLASSSFFS
ncbi:hypothetical protein LZQ00_10315 [Sphingobacterium sp. SRCM116780]|uniref:hypothetical protein n=1 Tax=Sphingobacterium sp. SRCM116780 TaxID=2907623 RepID=UPI001F2A7557|nr:hypothetical protein [Sphingobacterium sp. SRCM116780]UIR54669.1 hypothetical protein LZQ00_10315 [Sphingobacterium sp. SRCM116780]